MLDLVVKGVEEMLLGFLELLPEREDLLQLVAGPKEGES